MNDQSEKQQQEWEFVMEGITTRMQIAMEKISDSNKLLRSTVKYVCIVMLAVVLIVISGFIINNTIWIKHVDNLRNITYVNEEVTDATIPQFRSGTNDK